MPILPHLNTFILQVDNALKTLLPPEIRHSTRSSPDININEASLSPSEKKQVAGLMRVNHAGEVCAQALYQGQALTAKLSHIKAQMVQCAKEEVDHLAWCEKRLNELNSHPSIFNPLWYAGSFLIGAAAGAINDKISLGFVAETEKQVGSHLQQHLEKLPPQDKKSIMILTQMQQDEREHADKAIAAGAIEFPAIMQKSMQLVSRLMTKLSYYY